MITIDKALLQKDGTPSLQLLGKLLEVHGKNAARLKGLQDFYQRHHKIEKRSRMKGVPNNRLAHDMPGYIVTMASGYLVGKPVQYAPPEAAKKTFEPIAEALKAANSDSVDAELAMDASIFGKAMEICYTDEQARPRMAQFSPLRGFCVYDSSVAHNVLLGITITPLMDENLRETGEAVRVYTTEEILHYTRSGGKGLAPGGREFHRFGGVPLVEYWNNDEERGDFENVMDLIDAYDLMQSDRINDKQQFTDAVLFFTGFMGFSEDDTIEVDIPEECEGACEVDAERKEKLTPMQRYAQTKVAFGPSDAAGTWLTKPAVQADTEILRKALKDDIHKLCMVPDLTDENFVGNVSGVAMRFKLLGLEQLTRIKERWFREGLRSRLRLFSHFLGVRGFATMDTDTVQITLQHSLPVNELEIAQTLQAYEGLVPDELRMTQVPFVEDAEAAMAAKEKERQEDAKYQNAVFSPDGAVGGGASAKDDRT